MQSLLKCIYKFSEESYLATLANPDIPLIFSVYKPIDQTPGIRSPMSCRLKPQTSPAEKLEILLQTSLLVKFMLVLH